MTIGRRRLDYTEVASAHETELQRTWNGGRRECQCVHRAAHLTQFLLGRYTELLLFVNNQKSQIVEVDTAAQ